MYFAFTLSMPSTASWDGKWSRRDKNNVIVRSYDNQATIDRILSRGRYSYNFGDGWVASVEVRVVTANERSELIATSDGFNGYDWMVDSIIADGEIYGPMKPKPTAMASMPIG